MVVQKFKSTHLKHGQADKNNWVWFLPEEVLYPLERGSLDIRWPDLNLTDRRNHGHSKVSSTCSLVMVPSR
jgi:hypothetical protein